MPRFHLGTWLTWTIVTPNGSLVVFGHGNAIWSAQINLFCKRFCLCFCFTLFFARYLFLFLLRFFKPTKFSTNQLTEHSSRQSGDYLPGLILVVNILLWSNTVFIITRHGLHGKPTSYIYIYIQELLSPPTMWVCKTPLQDWPSQLHAERGQVLCITKIWSYT